MATYHLQMKVSTVLEMLGDDDGAHRLEVMFEIPMEDIYLVCERLTKAGKLYIPTEGCNTTEPTGKCLGHG